MPRRPHIFHEFSETHPTYLEDIAHAAMRNFVFSTHMNSHYFQKSNILLTKYFDVLNLLHFCVHFLCILIFIISTHPITRFISFYKLCFYRFGPFVYLEFEKNPRCPPAAEHSPTSLELAEPCKDHRFMDQLNWWDTTSWRLCLVVNHKETLAKHLPVLTNL